MLQCYNRGCGQTYDPDKNDETSCTFHPGSPYFHDAYKGWSCCNKKSIDFTEFLSIKGCTQAKHSNEKPPEPEKPKEANEASDRNEVIEVRAPIKQSMPRPSIETAMVRIEAEVAPALKNAIDTQKVKAPVAVESNKLAAGEIAVGTSCKNSGCTYSFSGTVADANECQYHPGVPIFHEGMKFWSCCQKRTADFTVFMAQKGCIFGSHKWFKENDDNKVMQCRYDWHQTGSNVIVSIYAKKYHYSQSSIKVNPIRLQVQLVFPEQDDAKFDLDLELRGVIDTSKTKAYMYGTKVEITMPKAEPGSWPKLDFERANLPKSKDSSDDNQKKQSSNTTNSESDDDFDLDDIDTVNTGFKLSEMASNNKNNLD